MSEPAAAEIESLRDQIRHHDDLYFNQARPEISDQQYDALMRRLLETEAKHPELLTPDSPSQRLGGAPIDGFKTVRHALRMMSIDNTYDEAEVREFDARVRRLLGSDKFSYTCEPKIDGVSLSLRYENGRLITAATRGDGNAGDDVTHNARTMRNVPMILKTQGPSSGHGTAPAQHSALNTQHSIIEVRGEAYITRAQFVKLNEAQEEAGEETYANPRNTAAGALKQLDPKIAASRKLEFLPHGSGEIVGLEVSTFHQWQEILREIGFKTSERFQRCPDVEAVLAYIREFAESRRSLPYDTDGVVVKIDDYMQRETLGYTAKSPRWCIAYKYQPERAPTQVVRVIFNVGKTGTITPVAEFEPIVFISGTNVYRASLHNFDEIERKDIHLNDWVLVEKAGEVIPYVVEVVQEKRAAVKNLAKIKRPTECPSCGSRDLENDGGFVRCTNPDCPAQLAERIRYWTGRNQMDIAEVGEKLIEKLIAREFVKSIPDLYRLTHEQAVEALRREGTKKESNPAKAAQNVIDGIAASKTRGLARVLAGLGIRHIGVRTAQVIAGELDSLEKLEKASLEEILRVPDMGGGVVDDFKKYQERHPEFAEMTLEEVFELKKPAAKLAKWLAEAPARGAREKPPAEIAADLRNRGVAAQSLYLFLHSAAGKKTFADLAALGVTLSEPRASRSGPQPLAGKTIVVTGTLSHFSRNDIKKKIESLGGKTSESVSGATSFLVAGEDAGSKLQKAKKLGVEIIDEPGFLKRIGEA